MLTEVLGGSVTYNLLQKGFFWVRWLFPGMAREVRDLGCPQPCRCLPQAGSCPTARQNGVVRGRKSRKKSIMGKSNCFSNNLLKPVGSA